jgi:hypothetical protein
MPFVSPHSEQPDLTIACRQEDFDISNYVSDNEDDNKFTTIAIRTDKYVYIILNSNCVGQHSCCDDCDDCIDLIKFDGDIFNSEFRVLNTSSGRTQEPEISCQCTCNHGCGVYGKSYCIYYWRLSYSSPDQIIKFAYIEYSIPDLHVLRTFPVCQSEEGLVNYFNLI